MSKNLQESPESRNQGFDIHDRSRVTHIKIGVWDFYVDKKTLGFRRFVDSRRIYDLRAGMAALLQIGRDISGIEGCFMRLTHYILATIVVSLVPAIRIWYYSQLLAIIDESISAGKVNESKLWTAVMQSVGYRATEEIANIILKQKKRYLEGRVNAYYRAYTLRIQAKLDCRTHDDPSIQRLFSAAKGRDQVWWTLEQIFDGFRAIVQTTSKFFVIFIILSRERHGLLFGALYVIPAFSSLLKGDFDMWASVWAATCSDENYCRSEGLELAGTAHKYRKELIASNLQEYVTSQFLKAQSKLRSHAADMWDSVYNHNEAKVSFLGLALAPVRELCEAQLLLLSLRSNSVSEIAHTVGSLAVIRRNAYDLYDSIYLLLYHSKDVSFKYPTKSDFALKNVSFKIEMGQLCVIVGANGSGKSTLMKLLLRLYEPQSGKILVNGFDLQAIHPIAIRRSISVMFQDYTHFPVSVKENIGMGNPSRANDMDLITKAAELGGASEVIAKLKQGYDSYLEPPVTDWFYGIPEETTSLFGKTVKPVGGGHRCESIQSVERLSGGEEQRLALSKSFMRSLGDGSPVSLLMFDEPSAALDPEAEYVLFQRLRTLRESKSMIFSSHRFGNLTRHADVIIYMKHASVLEVGTHDELVKVKNGGYAHMYRIQAEAFPH